MLTGTTDTMNGYERVSITGIMETLLSLKEKIAKKWYRFELMEQFNYRNSLVEFVDQLSSTPVLLSESYASFFFAFSFLYLALAVKHTF